MCLFCSDVDAWNRNFKYQYELVRNAELQAAAAEMRPVNAAAWQDLLYKARPKLLVAAGLDFGSLLASAEH